MWKSDSEGNHYKETVKPGLNYSELTLGNSGIINTPSAHHKESGHSFANKIKLGILSRRTSAEKKEIQMRKNAEKKLKADRKQKQKDDIAKHQQIVKDLKNDKELKSDIDIAREQNSKRDALPTNLSAADIHTQKEIINKQEEHENYVIRKRDDSRQDRFAGEHINYDDPNSESYRNPNIPEQYPPSKPVIVETGRKIGNEHVAVRMAKPQG